MKRHILFIYIVALLMMLGTALPMSAQNKSFTVNRNDGASQKYSYSQGDRLVLSREDSQGKKYADFVEQQVYVGNDVHNIPLTSIESITFDTHATEDEGKTFTVQESGGKIEYDDITIDFPNGTFNSATKVTISEVEKGTIDGEDEISKYYKVKFYGGVRKSFKVGVKSDEYANDNALKMSFAMMGFAQGLNQEMLARNLLDVTYSNGSYVAEISEMESPDEVSDMEVYYGLTSYVDSDNLAYTRSSDRTDFNVDICKLDYLQCIWNYGLEEMTTLKWSMKRLIPEVMDLLESLGYRKQGSLQYWLGDYDYLKAGCCTYSPFHKTYSDITLNIKRLLGKSDIVRKALIIHETLHYYQQFYDPRKNIVICGLNKTVGDKGSILREAQSTWSEGLYNEGILPYTTIENISFFLPSINPDHKDITNYSGNPIWSERYQDIGYAMGSLMEYLTQKYGKEIIFKMSTLLYESKKDPTNEIKLIEEAIKPNVIFTQEAYKDFVEKLGMGKVYKYREIETSNKDFMDFETIMSRSGREKHGNIGELVATISGDAQPVTLTNWVYSYGALLERITIDSNFNGDAVHGLDDAHSIIEQKTEGVKTWVYGHKNGEYYLIGQTKIDSPLDISNTFYKDGDKYVSQNYYLVTIADNFTTTNDILSNIEAVVDKRDVRLEVDPKKLEFDADGGTKYLDIITNQPSFTYEKDKDWPSWLKVEINKDFTMKVTAEPNTSAERKATITVYALDAKGNQVGQPAKVEVTQKGNTNYNGKFIGSWAWGKPGDAVYEKYTFASDGTLYRNGVVYGTFTVIADDHDSDPSGGLILEKKVLSVTRNGKQSTWNITVAYEFDSVDMQGNYIYAEVLYVGWNPYDKVEDEE